MKRMISAIAALALMGIAAFGSAPHRIAAATRGSQVEAIRYGSALLLPRDGKGNATGALVITPMIDGLRLALSVAHLQPKTTYSAFIYGGSCSDSTQGMAQYILPDLTTDAQGSGMLVTTFPASSVSSSWYIDVPVKQTSQTKAPGPGVVCGNILAAGVELDFHPPEGSGDEDVSHVLLTRHVTKQGNVDLLKTLGAQIGIYAERLAAGVTYKVNIINGSCDGPGPVKYRLPSLQANAAGQVVGVTYINGALPVVNLALRIEDPHGRVVTCANFPGYGLTQPEMHS